MAGRRNGSINKLSDLPNFKMNFPHALDEMGITTLDELKDALRDDSRTASLVRNVKGLGPKIIETWKEVTISPTRANALSTPIISGGEGPLLMEDSVAYGRRPQGPALERTQDDRYTEEPNHGGTNLSPSSSGELTTSSLFCSLDDAQEIKQTLIDLLKWNGVKRKGLASMVRYVVQRLEDGGLTVSVIDDEVGDPLIITASKGQGGLVIWGHLDTGREGKTSDTLQGIVALDFVYGRGVVDMKGALAALLCAAPRMMRWDVPFTIILTTDALDEQKGAQCMALNPLIRESKGILVLAPTDLCPAYGQVGRLDVNVTIFGEGSILAASAFLERLALGTNIPPGQEWLRVGLMRGGKRGNPFGLANSCLTSFRLLTAYPTEGAVDMIEDALHNSDHLTEIVWRSEPIELDRGSSLVKEAERARGKDARLYDVKTEVGRLSASHPNICICGPGNPYNSGSAHESVVLTDLEKTFELILSLVDSTSTDDQR